ncbi:MAG: hypothetical protein PWP64_615 [Candidatus Cloacimonadota bacterium]|nr:hypothetical protein [Candidatus Cloacimonadota bacterium]
MGLRVVISGIGMQSKMPCRWNSQGIGNRSGLWELSHPRHGLLPLCGLVKKV